MITFGFLPKHFLSYICIKFLLDLLDANKRLTET